MIGFLQITFQPLSGWTISQSVILLSNYFNPKETQQIERRVNGSKDKVKVTRPSVIQEYNQFMGGVDLSDQMKVTCEVDRLSKFHFCLHVFFDFLDIAVVSSKIVYSKIESAPSLSSLNFEYSLAQTMIQNFQAEKKLFRYPHHPRGQEVHHLTLWIIYLTLHSLEFVVPFVHRRMSKVELTYAV